MSVVEKASSAMNGHIHEHSRTAAFDGKQMLVKSCEDGVCKQEKLDTKEKIRRYILEKQPHSLTLMQRLKRLRGTSSTSKGKSSTGKGSKGKGKGSRRRQQPQKTKKRRSGGKKTV